MAIDLKKLNQVIDEAWGDVVLGVDAAMTSVIEDDQAFASYGTYFQGRDIVDTGRLRDSQTINVENNCACWTFDPIDPKTGYHYAAAVYAGFYAYGGSKYVPGRPWPLVAIDRAMVADTFATALNKRGCQSKVVAKRRLS